MTRSDIVKLLQAGITRTTIRNYLKMDSATFFEMIKDMGLSKQDEIKEVKDVPKVNQKKKLEMSVDEFLELSKTMNTKQIANKKGVTVQAIYNWRSKHKKQIEEKRNKALLEELLQSEGKTTQTEIKDGNELNKKEIIVLENELREEYENEIEKLKRELIAAHKNFIQFQDKYDKLRDQFSDALAVKDLAIKENAELENMRLKLERENKALSNELDHLKKEIVILRELSYLKLAKEVESA